MRSVFLRWAYILFSVGILSLGIVQQASADCGIECCCGWFFCDTSCELGCDACRCTCSCSGCSCECLEG